ncbi:MAG TPA: ATP-binding protein [Gammaproteobacteria bacterium]|nr:ATP-binding protein [Gammaproteobacteria bacterium]
MTDDVDRARMTETALEIARLQRLVELQRKETELVRRLSRVSTVDALLGDILAYIRERWGFSAVGIQLVDEERQVLRGYRTRGVTLTRGDWAALAVDVPLDANASVAAWAALEQSPLYIHPSVVPKVPASVFDRRVLATLELAEAFIIPIVEDGRTLGVVHLGLDQCRPELTQEQLEEAREFILGMTAPIRGAVIREQLERSRREQAELAALCQRISTSIELPRLLDVLGEEVLAEGLFDGYLVSLPDAAGDALICRHIRLPPEFTGMESAYLDVRQPLDAADPLAEAYREGRTVVVRAADLGRWPTMQHRFQRWRIQVAVALPIPLERGVVGLVFAFRQREPLNAGRLRLLQQRLPLFSEQIRNALFYTDMRRREEEVANSAAERQRFLDFTSRLVELTDPEQIYQFIANSLLKGLPFDLAGIVLREGDGLAVKWISVRDKELEPLRRRWRAFYRNRPFRLDPADGATAFAYVNDTRVLIPDVMQVLDLPMSASDREALALMGTPRTFLFLPIRRRQASVGVLWLISVRQTVTLPEREIELIEALCDVIGTAIGNADLYATVEMQRREIEAALRELRQAQDQLASAKAAAEASAAAKSVFVANTSHEIRTPLTAIIGFAEILLEQADPESSTGLAASTILRNGRHLLGLINDILDLSKIEAGQLEFEQAAYSPAELLQDVAATMKLLAQGKGLHFRVKAGSPLPEQVVGDPIRVRQALFNLCNNAIKFTHSGGVDVEVRCDLAAKRLHLQVRDSGIGIRAEDQAMLFQPFTQVEEAVSRRYGGTGLGLAITRQLVEGMGGTISVSSELGRGTEFEVTLPTGPLQGVPLRQSPIDVDYPAADTTVAQGDIRLTGRVLVADDSADNRELVRHYLDQLGVQSTLVESGRQAVAAALGSPFDLLIFDIQMPEMSGLEALANLQACGFDKPVIALTANVMAADTQRYQQAGFVACLAKPIERQVLVATLQRYLPPAGGGLAVPRRDADISMLAERFAQELPGRLALLEAGLQAGDWELLATEAHKLKGTAGVFGWPSIGMMAAEIEELLRGPDSPSRRQALTAVLRQATGLVREA